MHPTNDPLGEAKRVPRIKHPTHRVEIPMAYLLEELFPVAVVNESTSRNENGVREKTLVRKRENITGPNLPFGIKMMKGVCAGWGFSAVYPKSAVFPQ